MTSFQVTCVTSVAPRHDAITHVGGPSGGGWIRLASQIVQTIENGDGTFYVILPDGNVAWLAVVSGARGKYLHAHARGAWTNALLDLPPCRAPG
jgi:hypothetical protein